MLKETSVVFPKVFHIVQVKQHYEVNKYCYRSANYFWEWSRDRSECDIFFQPSWIYRLKLFSEKIWTFSTESLLQHNFKISVEWHLMFLLRYCETLNTSPRFIHVCKTYTRRVHVRGKRAYIWDNYLCLETYKWTDTEIISLSV